ncbi:T cell receptor delta chain [Pelobates cultripes]|nr:T cell receptor delta chain [Pelobates cultripes]
MRASYHSLLVILVNFWGENSALQLMQGDSISIVQKGHGVTLNCSMEGGQMGSYYMFWYKKDSKGQIIFVYREGDVYGPGFHDIVVGNVKASINLFTLHIKSSALTDHGIYYCASCSAQCKILALFNTINSLCTT